MTNRNVNPNVTYKISQQYTGKPDSINITTLFEYFNEMLALENMSYTDNRAFNRLGTFLSGEAKLVFKYQKTIHKFSASRLFALIHLTFEKKNSIME